MRAWKIVNIKTNAVRGIAYEKMLDAINDARELSARRYVIKRCALQPKEAYVPKTGKSPAFA